MLFISTGDKDDLDGHNQTFANKTPEKKTTTFEKKAKHTTQRRTS